MPAASLVHRDTRPWRRSPRRGAEVVSRRYHFHGPGIAYAGTLVVLMLGAINGQNNVLYWLFGLGLAGLIISGILSGAALMGLELEREAPGRVVRGQRLTIRYRLRNRSFVVPAFALTIEELALAPRGRPGGTWQSTTDTIRGAAMHVPVRGESVGTASCTPRRSGRFRFGAVRVSTTFPFGLARKSVTFWSRGEVLVVPQSPPVRTSLLDELADHGLHAGLARRARGGEEFFALREYAPGDPFRRVAWRATARQDRLIVRELADAGTGRIILVPDVPSEDARAEQTLDAAAGLARAALERGLFVGVQYANGVLAAPVHGGGRHLDRCLEALACAVTGPVQPRAGNRGQIVIVGDSGAMTESGILRITASTLGIDANPAPEPTPPGSWRSRLLARWKGRP
ncbi:MAG: hypothetical protein HBSAPP03_27580 [Phycisphaerae bacterium]|nr:MAG: hypothetical protein HBSAPP03_27580 [Phycisphaerae bacterium]